MDMALDVGKLNADYQGQVKEGQVDHKANWHT